MPDAAAHSPPVLAYPLKDALYLNLTSSCTLACIFCPKIRDRDFMVGSFDLRLSFPPSLEDVWQAAVAQDLRGRSEVVFTGFGEPTHRLEVMLELARRLKREGVLRVRLDTDGLANLREGRNVVPELAAAGVDAMSVSLNAPDSATYARLCPSRYGADAYQASCEFIRAGLAAGLEVWASCVALPELAEGACRAVAESLGARFRWRPYDRLGRL